MNIGITKSGKEINANFDMNVDFTTQDHEDAVQAHAQLAVSIWNESNGDSNEEQRARFAIHWENGHKHSDRDNVTYFTGAFNDIKYGKGWQNEYR